MHASKHACLRKYCDLVGLSQVSGHMCRTGARPHLQVDLWQQVGARRQRLPYLDEGGAQPRQHIAKLARPAAPSSAPPAPSHSPCGRGAEIMSTSGCPSARPCTLLELLRTAPLPGIWYYPVCLPACFLACMLRGAASLGSTIHMCCPKVRLTVFHNSGDPDPHACRDAPCNSAISMMCCECAERGS